MSFLSQPLQFFSIGPTRSFSGFEGYVTIQENTVDALELTQHPVQQGAMISDHAFKKPTTLSVQIRFSENLSQSLADIYISFLALQQPQAQPLPPKFLGIITLPSFLAPPAPSLPKTLTPFDVV